MSPSAVLSRVSLFHEEKSLEFKQQFTKKLKIDVLEANQDQFLSEEELEAVISVEKTDDLHRAAFEDFFLFLWTTSQEDLKKYFVLTFTPVLNNPLVVSKVKTLHDLHIGDEIVAQERSDIRQN